MSERFALEGHSPNVNARDVGAPLRELCDRVTQGASGEFVCTCASGEVHVFLQGGRIAWANDAKNRHAFTHHLKEHVGVDQSAIDSVVEECRRTRRHLGEVILGWKLATAAQVSAAIQHQARLALECLQSRCEACKAVFLKRSQYKGYDARFTFALSDLIRDLPPGVAAPARSAPDSPPSHVDGQTESEPGVAPTAAAEGAAPVVPIPLPGTAAILAALRSVPGVLRAVIRRRDGRPIGDDSFESEELAGQAQYVAMMCSQLAERLRAGEVQIACLHGADRQLLLFTTRYGAVTVLVDPQVPLGKVEADVRNAIRRTR